MQRPIDPRSVIVTEIPHGSAGGVEVFPRDGFRGKGDVSRREGEASERRAAQVHDDLDDGVEVGAGRERGGDGRGEEGDEAHDLVAGRVRRRGERGR